MLRLTRGFLGVLLSAALCLVHGGPAKAAAGRISGSATVTQTGAFSYQIPIWAPSGTEGIQPAIALVYNNQLGNGPAGVGWSVAGLSSITRCQRNFAQDTRATPVLLDSTDALCLDGKRLRLFSGDYGAPSATYQTEVADFQKITGVSGIGDPAGHFFVNRLDGLIYEYGLGGNSLILANGTNTPVEWKLSQITDRSGAILLTISYSATNQDSNLQSGSLPTTISWAPTSAAASAYIYSMQFNYIAATASVSQGYTSGSAVQNSYLLNSIDVLDQGKSVRYYKLDYHPGLTSARQTLTSIKECADNTAADCLQPTTMQYQSGQAGIEDTPVTVTTDADPSSNSHPNYDFNGDGLSDLTWYQEDTNSWWVSFNTGTGFGPATNTGISDPYPYSTTFEAVDSSGIDGWKVLQSNHTRTFYRWNGSAFAATATGMRLADQYADLDGDGIPDLISQHDGYEYISRTSPTAIQGAIQTIPMPNGSSTPDISFTVQTRGARRIVMTGDGQQDVIGIVRAPATTATIYHFDNDFYSPSLQASTFYAGSPDAGFLLDVGDYNDDGCQDLLFNWILALSACNGVAAKSIPLVGAWTGFDWNEDGRTDVLVKSSTATGVQLLTGNGLSALVPATIPCDPIPYAQKSCTVIHNAFGDGLDALLVESWSGSAPMTVQYYRHNGLGQMADLITSISDGYGNVYQPTLVPLVRANYTKGTLAVFPEQERILPIYVVSSLAESDGTGATYTKTFSYVGARQNMQGRGFEGFQSMTAKDTRLAGITQTTSFETNFPLTGMKKEEDLFQSSDGAPISAATYANTATTLDSTKNNQRYFPHADHVSTKSHEVTGAGKGNITSIKLETFTYDNYGNILTDQTIVSDNDSWSPSPYSAKSWTTTKANTPNVNVDNWCLPLLSRSQVTRTSSESTKTVTNTTKYVADVTNYCRYDQIITEPDQPAYLITETLTYGLFGNVSSDTLVAATGGASPTSRTTTADWGTTGLFPIQIKDPSGAVTQRSYNFDTGLLASATDPNGVTTSWTYDGFGRAIRESYADGTSKTWNYSAYSGSDALPRVLTTEQHRDIADNALTTTVVYSDAFDRPIYQLDTLLDGTTSWMVRRTYDSFGRVQTESVPYRDAGAAGGVATYRYDILNRPVLMQIPTSSTVPTLRNYTIGYQGDRAVYTDSENNRTTLIFDALGTYRQAQDANGYSVMLAYDPAGSVTSATDSLGNTLWTGDWQYGALPFEVSETDMDRGASTYTYNAFGELTAWTLPSTNDKGQRDARFFTATYDGLSRVLSETGIRGFDGTSTTDRYAWGSSAASHDLYKLQGIDRYEYSEGCGDDTCAHIYGETYSYDNFVRVYQRSISIPSLGRPAAVYTWQYSPTTGYLDTLTYPSTGAGVPLSVRYGYQHGEVQSVTAISQSPNIQIWSATSVDAAGRITAENLGNGIKTTRSYDSITGLLTGIDQSNSAGTVSSLGYLYDSVGNVILRQDNRRSLNESFCYDNLYRLDHSTLTGSCSSAANLQLHYDQMGNISSRSDVAGGALWTYDPQRKHQVLQAGSNTYSYTDAGTMMTRNGIPLNWAVDGLLTGFSDSTPDELVLSYRPGGRWLLKSLQNSAFSEGVWNVGDLTEFASDNAAPGYTQYRQYIFAGSRPIAIASRADQSTAAAAWSYLGLDRAGGVAALTDSSANLVEAESFTAFGSRRNAATWSGAPAPADLRTMDRVARHGYNFQSNFETPGLVFMGGRVEDSVVGRFLSADPNVSEAQRTQDFNHYSYVDNNPLTYSDPSGNDIVVVIIQSDGNVIWDSGIGAGDTVTVYGTSGSHSGFGTGNSSANPPGSFSLYGDIEGMDNIGIGVGGRINISSGKPGVSIDAGHGSGYTPPSSDCWACTAYTHTTAGPAIPPPSLKNEVVAVLAPIRTWWNTSSTVTVCSTACAKGWDGTASSPFGPQDNTATNGARLNRALTALSVLAIPVQGALGAAAAARAIPELPAFMEGGKTVGVLRTAAGDVPLRSGWAGPASNIPRGTKGFDIVTRTHVEGHAAAAMRQAGVSEGTLYINNPTICSSCSNLLQRMLPAGARLNVVTPSGSTTFVGTVP